MHILESYHHSISQTPTVFKTTPGSCGPPWGMAPECVSWAVWSGESLLDMIFAYISVYSMLILPSSWVTLQDGVYDVFSNCQTTRRWWTIPLQGITWRPPQELIDVGLLDTTGWVDLAIPTKNHRLPWTPNASKMSTVSHPEHLQGFTCSMHCFDLMRLVVHEDRLAFVPVIMLANPKAMAYFVHMDRKKPISQLESLKLTWHLKKLVVGRLVSFWKGISSGATLVYRNALPLTKVEISQRRCTLNCLIWTNATG